METAAGVTRIVDAKMSDLIRRMSVLRGFDPRDFVCFAFGGGGPVHAGALCAEIGIGAVVVPLLDIAPVWSAFGAATADVSHLYAEPMRLAMPADPQVFNTVFDRLETQARATLSAEGFQPGAVSLERTVRMKYAAQIHDVGAPAPAGVFDDSHIAALAKDFEAIYRNIFGTIAARSGSKIEVTGFELRASGLTYKPNLLRRGGGGQIARTSRSVYWPELGEAVETEVLQMTSGVLAEPLLGPALIELPYSVCVVRPGQSAASDAYGNLVVKV